MAGPYISFHNLLEGHCLPVALFLGVMGLEISVDFWGWYPRLGLSAEGPLGGLLLWSISIWRLD